MPTGPTPTLKGREPSVTVLKIQPSPHVWPLVATLVLFGAIGVSLLGCNRPEPPLVPSQFFSPQRPFDAPVPVLGSVTGQLSTGQDWDHLNELLDQAVAQPSSFFVEIVAPDVLAQSESYFFQSGRGSELVQIYLERVLEVGPASTYAPRLAFIYNLLGYRTEARALLNGALEAGVDTADLHFTWAFLLADENEFSAELLIEVASHLLTITSRQTDYDGILTYDQAWLDQTMSQLSPLVLEVAARGLTSIAQEHLHQAIPNGF